jgi:protein-S-isoprenylcysteine O-methyltransferase Ste14
MATVWCYWASVVVMIVRSRLKLKAAAGAVPKTGLESWMWLIWVPTVLAWQVLPGMGYISALPLLKAPQWAIDHPSAVLDWTAVVAAILAYALTVPCWLTLGSNWSLAIVPGKETRLVTRGFYARTRHPIYALGLVLMAATIAVAPSPAMILTGVSHLVLVLLKAANEERFLKQEHGQAYVEYCRRTSRFFPWSGKTSGQSAPS